MQDLAPDIFRQRLLVEAHYQLGLQKQDLGELLTGLAAELGLTPYGEVVVFSPGEDQGRPENAGFDAFLPLVDSGIAAYFWSKPRFASLLIYSCAAFDEGKAVEYLRRALNVEGEMAWQAI